MNKEQLISALQYVNHSRDKRKEMANLVLNNRNLVLPLFEILDGVDVTISERACWVLEFASKENLSFILPHLDLFISCLPKLRSDPAVRPMAKICERLMEAYFKNREHTTACKEFITTGHLKSIASSCFDWLIGDHKVAAKAYSMTSLFLLGKKFNWIYPELHLILEQSYAEGSAAYKARARMVLAKIDK